MTLDVVGGTYREVCKEGEWRQLYGSGLRAAAALKHSASIRLHTYVGSSELLLLEAMGATFGIELFPTQIARTIEFSYDHGLSVPLISPPLHTVTPAGAIQINADQILRFGMVDGDAIVQGEMVVYDPQSAYSPVLFHANGSTAKRLVVVCNRRESLLLTGEADVPTAAARLQSLEGAEAVIVKCGSHGAYLVSESGQHHIPAFRTNRIWPIGSGDIFAAAFFACWSKGQAHLDAALTASKATAHYCETRSLPLPSIPGDLPDYVPLTLREPGDQKRPRVYLAGPFFNMGQRWIVEEARQALADQGLEVFSPFHDIGFGVAEEVVPADIAALRKADIVLALLDHLDSGTLFEVGYARCLGKPVIGFCQNTPEETLKMLVGTECHVADDFVSAIYHTAWAAFRS